MTVGPLLSRIVSVSSISDGGTGEVVSASAAQLPAIAEAFDLLELRSLSADLVATAGKRGLVTVEGRLKAELVQSCIVTLVPVVEIIDEPISRRFAPEGTTPTVRPGEELRVDLAESDPPDPYADGRIDLGAMVIEELALSIDPYPRAPGAELPPLPADAEEPPDSPFAVLGAMKPPRRS